MPRIAVFGGTGYLASIIKNQNNLKKNQFTFFSRKKFSKNYINYLSFKKKFKDFKNFEFIIHLAGPNQNNLKKNKNLIKEKNLITKAICDLCLHNNIKLIYISSLRVYKNYGKNNISIYSKINKEDLYSKLHYESEKIIQKKFLGHTGKYIILRMGNVFGFKKYESLKEIDNNLINSFCYFALKKNKILINNGNVERSFIPSQIFVDVINFIIRKNFFKNSIFNFFYKNLSLKDVVETIQKRAKIKLNFNIKLVINNYTAKETKLKYFNNLIKLKPSNKRFFFEIDQILKNLNKLKN